MTTKDRDDVQTESRKRMTSQIVVVIFFKKKAGTTYTLEGDNDNKVSDHARYNYKTREGRTYGLVVERGCHVRKWLRFKARMAYILEVGASNHCHNIK